jgi:hypothetical protein
LLKIFSTLQQTPLFLKLTYIDFGQLLRTLAMPRIRMTAETSGKSKVETWTPIGISVLALVLSVASLVIAYQADSRKDENLQVGFTKFPYCETPYVIQGSDRATLMLCWVIHVTNLSEDDTSVTRFKVFREGESMETTGDRFEIVPSDFEQLVPVHLKTVYPLALKSGETKLIVVRLVVDAPPFLRQLMTQEPLKHLSDSHQLAISAFFMGGNPGSLCELVGAKPPTPEENRSTHGLFSCDSPYRVILTTARGSLSNVGDLPVGMF